MLKKKVFCVKESSNGYEQGITKFEREIKMQYFLTNEKLTPEYLHVYNANESEVLRLAPWSSLVDVKAGKIVKETNIKSSLTSEAHFSLVVYSVIHLMFYVNFHFKT